MESYKLLHLLNSLPKAYLEFEGTYVEKLDLLNHQDHFIQGILFSNIAGYHLLETRNIPDDLFHAYESSFTKSETTLYEHYLSMLEKGDPSTIGFISTLKGKFFEYYLKDSLEEQYSGYTFEIATNPIQPVWDIKGTNEDGEEILVQAKMWAGSRASDLKSLMEENPNVLYATSSEIREKILQANPELQVRFIPIEVTNYQFTKDVQDALETLRENFGIDLPDEAFALLPYSTEIILGIRLLYDLIQVNRDFSQVKMTEKSRIAAVKVLVLFSRFGVTTILTIAGSAAGTAAAPGIGSAIGGITGAITASVINKKIAPHSLELAYKLMKITPEDMFYYKNINRITGLARSYLVRKAML